MGKKVNRAELAEFFGVSLPTISAWVTRGCPFLERGQKGKEWSFDTAQVAEWRREQAVADALGDTSKMDIEEANRRSAVANAEIREIELRRMKGELVEIADVAATVGDDYARCRARMLAIPSKITPRLSQLTDPAAIRATVETAITEALAELSSHDADTSRPDEGDLDGPTP